MTCLEQVPLCFRTLKNKLFYWFKIKYRYKHPTCGISGLREHCPTAGFAPLPTAAETSNVHSVPEKQQKSSSTVILQNHSFFIVFLLKETLVLGSLKLYDVKQKIYPVTRHSLCLSPPFSFCWHLQTCWLPLLHIHRHSFFFRGLLRTQTAMLEDFLKWLCLCYLEYISKFHQSVTVQVKYSA